LDPGNRHRPDRLARTLSHAAVAQFACLPLRNHGTAIQARIRQAEPPVVPGSRPLHEHGIDGVDRERPDRLEDVGDGGRARTRIAGVVHHVREHAGDAGTVLVLHEHVAVIGVAAYGGEDHGDILRAEIPARQNAGRVVVDAADREIAGETGMGDYFFQPERATADLRRHDTLGLQIPGERDCFVLADILYIEALAVQIAGLHDILIEQRDFADAFSHQGGRDLRVDPARPDAHHAALRERCLVESGNLPLPIVGSRNCCAAKLNRDS
jgi:hypothetical protein